MDDQNQNPQNRPSPVLPPDSISLSINQTQQNSSSSLQPNISNLVQDSNSNQTTIQDSDSIKETHGLELKSKWPLRLVLSSLVISLAFAGAVTANVLDLVPQNCNSVKTICSNYNSLTAHLLLFVIALLTAHLLLFVIALLISVLVVRFLVSKRLVSSLLIVLPVAALVGFSFESFTLKYLPNYFWNTNSSIIGYLGYALIAFVPILVGLFITTVTFSWTSKKAAWITVSLCLILTGATYFISPDYESSTVSSSSNSNKQAISGFNSINLQDLEKLPFTLYKPNLVPQNYKFVGEQELGNSFTTGDQASQADYLEIQYNTTNTQTLTPSGYDFYEFATPSYYNPPTDCGDNMPAIAGIGHITTPCQLIGHSTAGCNVYYSAPTYTTGSNAYCQIKSTLVVISYETDQPNTGGQIPGTTISSTLQMFNSLQQGSAKQLGAICSQNQVGCI